MQRHTLAILVLIAAVAESLANEPNEKLLALSEEERNAALAAYVRQGGEDCDAGIRSMQIGGGAGIVTWSVACKNQKSYSVGIAPDANRKAVVMSCEKLADYGKMLAIMSRRSGEAAPAPIAECWKKP